MQALEAIQAIDAVEVFKARQRIPKDLRGTSPYSSMTLWAFIVHADHDTAGKTCAYCEMFDGQTFRGDQLRTTFPDHYWKGIDIYPNVHMTLWGRESECGCLLIREPGGNELNLETWSSLDNDWMDNPGESRLIYSHSTYPKTTIEE